jgi:hypothetical protein
MYRTGGSPEQPPTGGWLDQQQWSSSKVGARVLGVVLNKAKDRQLGSYYYYEQKGQGEANLNGSGPRRAGPPNRAEDAIAQPQSPAADEQ